MSVVFRRRTPTALLLALVVLPFVAACIPQPASSSIGGSPPPAVNRLVVYDDGKPSEWQDWSWGGYNDFAIASPVFAGSRAIQFTANQPWAGFKLVATTPFDSAPYQQLGFAIRASEPGVQLVLVLYDENGQQLTGEVALRDVGGNPEQGIWKEYKVRLGAFTMASGKIGAFSLADSTGKPQAPIQIDSIAFIGDGSIPSATATAEPALTREQAIAAGFVVADGTRFTVKGETFRFVGLNIFDAAARPNGYRCARWNAYSDAELTAVFAKLKQDAGVTVIRFWAFQSYTAGGTEWTAIDRVVRAAKANDIRLIPVIENQWVHCTEGGEKYSWFAGQYTRPYGKYRLSYPDYASALVRRYRDEPTIMAWSLMNEAETSNQKALYEFTASMSSLIKSIDPNHLVTLSTQSTGQPNLDTAAFNAVYGLPTIDFAGAHDWGRGDVALPGGVQGALPPANTCWMSIACAMAQSQTVLNKPFVIGESGMRAGPGFDMTLDQRARNIEAKMNAFFALGGSGYMLWQWSPMVDEGYDIQPGDPVLPVLKKTASAIN